MSLPTTVEQYLRHHHLVVKESIHPAVFTAHGLAEVEHVPDSMVAKVVFFFCDDQLIMGVVPADRHLSLRRIRKSTGAKSVRLATEREITRRIGTMELGAVPPFGSMFGLPMCVDRSLLQTDLIEMPGGLTTEALKVRMADWLRAEAPQVLDLTRRPIRHRTEPHRNMDFDL